MALTPEDVVSKQFTATKFRREGYDQEEVDDFLDEVVEELRRLISERDELQQKLGAAAERVGQLTRAAANRESGAPKDAPAPQMAKAPEPVPPPAPPVQAAPVKAPEPAPQPVGQGQGPEAAAGMLALAQKLHDEYVRNGKDERDRIVSEAQAHVGRLIREAEDKQQQTLGSLEQERSTLERKIDSLRGFEREYRSRLKAYFQDQLRDLENQAAVAPNRGPGGGGASVPSNGQAAYAPTGGLSARGSYGAGDHPGDQGSGYPLDQTTS